MKKQKEKVLELVDELIEHRELEMKNNNIYRKSNFDLNEDFIENCLVLKNKIRNYFNVLEEKK